jgi:hypothetical protein
MVVPGSVWPIRVQSRLSGIDSRLEACRPLHRANAHTVHHTSPVIHTIKSRMQESQFAKRASIPLRSRLERYRPACAGLRISDGTHTMYIQTMRADSFAPAVLLYPEGEIVSFATKSTKLDTQTLNLGARGRPCFHTNTTSSVICDQA